MEEQRIDGGPPGLGNLVAVAIHSMLREAEASLMSNKSVTLDYATQGVNIQLAASKTDTQALEACPSWNLCPAVSRWACPYQAAKDWRSPMSGRWRSPPIPDRADGLVDLKDAASQHGPPGHRCGDLYVGGRCGTAPALNGPGRHRSEDRARRGCQGWDSGGCPDNTRGGTGIPWR